MGRVAHDWLVAAVGLLALGEDKLSPIYRDDLPN